MSAPEEAPRLVCPDVKIIRTKGGFRVFLNGDEVLYPILDDGVTVKRHGGSNFLTLTLLVNNVTMDGRKT